MLMISSEKMAVYRHTAHQRLLKIQHEQENRRKIALGLAREASELLKKSYNVKEVFLFGSLSRKGVFDEHSDIDLAVEGLYEKEYYKALARLSDLDMSFDIDLLMMEDAPPNLLKIIQNEGKKL